MPTSMAFMLISNLYSPVRPSCSASVEVAILAVSATPMGADRIRGTERPERIWVRVRVHSERRGGIATATAETIFLSVFVNGEPYSFT